jgi:pimeloyl-ACP methyl ester carboxylesterase
MKQYSRGGLTFDYIDEGPADGPVVVLLHGFPQFNTSWNAVIERLTAEGYRCVAPNQRGYSPGARPRRRRDYVAPELVEDVHALLDEIGAERVHLVGHDWGALVAWAAAADIPDRLATVTSFSVPHPGAFLRALVTSRQGLMSWYMYFFQLPWLPERLIAGRVRGQLRATGLPAAAADEYAAAMARPGALAGALGWYRGLPASRRDHIGRISVPTTYVWGRHDFALGRAAAQATGRFVSAAYLFVELDAGHWLPENDAAEVAALTLDRVGSVG